MIYIYSPLANVAQINFDDVDDGGGDWTRMNEWMNECTD